MWAATPDDSKPMVTHTITLRGDVQDVGLRALITEPGRSRDRLGVVFTEEDGTVRVVTGGSRDDVEAFVEAIRQRSADLRARIESVELEAIEGDVSLPPFTIPPTDDVADISRKLGKGVRTLTSIETNIEANTERLTGIEANTERLTSIEANTERLPRIEEQTQKLVDGQQRMIDILDERL